MAKQSGHDAGRDKRGYRVEPGQGPRIRSDIIDVYVVHRLVDADHVPGQHATLPKDHPHADHTKRTTAGTNGQNTQKGPPRHASDFRLSTLDVALLQLYRTKEPLIRTWQPVTGHVEPGETAPQAALREVREEIGLTPRNAAWLGMWALEQINPFYIAAIDCIVMSPRFVIEVAPDWQPTLNAEHDAFRWVHASQAWRRFMWPGQGKAIQEILEYIMPLGSLARHALAITPPR